MSIWRISSFGNRTIRIFLYAFASERIYTSVCTVPTKDEVMSTIPVDENAKHWSDL